MTHLYFLKHFMIQNNMIISTFLVSSSISKGDKNARILKIGSKICILLVVHDQYLLGWSRQFCKMHAKISSSASKRIMCNDKQDQQQHEVNAMNFHDANFNQSKFVHCESYGAWKFNTMG